jgi:putative ABC transport system ATP-binding protein
MLLIQSVAKKFNEQVSLTFPDHELQDGEQCVLEGDSGVGKTTLLHLLGGLISCEQGVVQLNGVDLLGMQPSERDVYRGRNIGLIFQKNYLINALNVYENIALAQRLAHVKEDSEGLMDLLDELGIAEKKFAKVNQLSHGQAQRVAIARAMVNRPELILADEPTASLDDKHAEIVIQMLKNQAHKYGANLIVATHDHRVKEMFEHKITLY